MAGDRPVLPPHSRNAEMGEHFVNSGQTENNVNTRFCKYTSMFYFLCIHVFSSSFVNKTLFSIFNYKNSVRVMGYHAALARSKRFCRFDVWPHCKWLFVGRDCDARCNGNVDVGSEKGNVSVGHTLRTRAVLSCYNTCVPA